MTKAETRVICIGAWVGASSLKFFRTSAPTTDKRLS